MKSFRGGVHPFDSKAYSADKQIETAPVPDKVIIPVRQHIGSPASPVVSKGDAVRKGQVIASCDDYVSSPVHATISGTVADIADYPNAVSGSCLSIVIQSDGKDEYVEGLPLNRNWQNLSKEELLKIIREAGIVGMGGATFPTHVKLNPPESARIDTFILNAAECEPYLTADYRMMLEYPERIVTGVQIAMKILETGKGVVGIEDNKPAAAEAMKKAFQGTGVEVKTVPTKYPQGAEKMLIKSLTGRVVPRGRLPMDVGVVVSNVGTAIAIADAVTLGIPLLERVATISGSAVREPKNLLIRIGASFEEAFEACGGFVEEPKKIIMGGPMMGFAQASPAVSVTKGVSGILALTKKDMNLGTESACIRCGSCLDACPMGLNPSMLSILGEKNWHEEAKDDYGLLDCIECGSCVFVCPSKRNIVQYIRYMKNQNAAAAGKK